MTGLRLGILGAGQLGRMLALAAARLGVRCRVLDPNPEACAAHVCEHVVAAYDDPAALDRFAQGLDAVTYEFENVPVDTARRLADRLPVHPNPDALLHAQHRARERELFACLGVATPRWRPVQTPADLIQASRDIGPGLLKSCRMGYDGKGQRRVDHAPLSPAHAKDHLDAVGAPAILDQLIPFRRELSVIAARDIDGAFATYPLCENVHAGGILRMTVAPVDVDDRLMTEAVAAAEELLARLAYVGVVAIEFFETHDGRLLANEFAPRVHNTGHWTIDGAVTSQFENHARAVLGLPLGSCQAHRHSAMVNLIGKAPEQRRFLAHLLAEPGDRVHWYGKSPRSGRKIGHVTRVCPSEREARDWAAALADRVRFG